MTTTVKQRSLHRVKIIAGQVQGLRKMIEAQAYCVDIINLSHAIQKSLKSLNSLILENRLKTHVTEQMKNAETEKAIKELMSIFKFTPETKP